jgi:hypothetical protein
MSSEELACWNLGWAQSSELTGCSTVHTTFKNLHSISSRAVLTACKLKHSHNNETACRLKPSHKTETHTLTSQNQNLDAKMLPCRTHSCRTSPSGCHGVRLLWFRHMYVCEEPRQDTNTKDHAKRALKLHLRSVQTRAMRTMPPPPRGSCSSKWIQSLPRQALHSCTAVKH